MSNKPTLKLGYHVFVSFRGDTRKHFSNVIVNALKDKSFDIFWDEEGLEAGEMIDHNLKEAIENSRSAVVVFSELYPTSTWCLEELVHIVKCVRTRGLKIITVFYRVEPTEVRWQTKKIKEHIDRHEQSLKNRWRKRLIDIARKVSGSSLSEVGNATPLNEPSFAQQASFDIVFKLLERDQCECDAQIKEEDWMTALTTIAACWNIEERVLNRYVRVFLETFAEVEKQFKNHKIKKSRWENALRECANRSAIHVKESTYEGEAIYKQIIEKARTVLNYKAIGLEIRMEKVAEYISEKLKDVLIIEIWGMRDLDKKTFAEKVHERYEDQFEFVCMVKDVGDKDLISLQIYLYEKLLGYKPMNVPPDLTTALRIQHGCSKKSLIILHDVSNLPQIEALVGEYKDANNFWLYGGSVLLITTRKEHSLLTEYGVNCIDKIDIGDNFEGLFDDFDDTMKIISQKIGRSHLISNIVRTKKSLEKMMNDKEVLFREWDQMDGSTCMQQTLSYKEPIENLIKSCLEAARRDASEELKLMLGQLDSSLRKLVKYLEDEKEKGGMGTLLVVKESHDPTNEEYLANGTMSDDLHEHTFGLQEPLRELKQKLIEEDKSVLVVSGARGCGKTTLVKEFRRDVQIKEKFWTHFVDISEMTSLYQIAQGIFNKDSQVPSSRAKENALAMKQFEKLARKLKPVLLILDDAKEKSVPLIEQLLKIRGYKILVTSEYALPELKNTYRLRGLREEDAMKLFSCWASIEENFPIPERDVKKIVNCLKEIPLVLKLIAKSLAFRPENVWRKTLRQFSDGSSVVGHNRGVLECLNRGLDDLIEKKAILKDCFMDLGLFPKGKRIPAAALIDIWSEIHVKDRFTVDHAIDNIKELEDWSLVNLRDTRNDLDLGDGYYSEKFVTQHEMHRELAIHQSNQENDIRKRQRLIVDVVENEFPTWLDTMDDSEMNAHILSISTDKEFQSIWPEIQFPRVKVAVLNFQTMDYPLPELIPGSLKILIVTNYGRCPSELKNLPLLNRLTRTKRIRFERIYFTSLSKPFLELKKLEKISFFMCGIGQAFSSCFSQTSKPWQNLTEINIDYCSDLIKLPDEICCLKLLKKLSITHCHNLCALPESLGDLKCLRVLRVRSCTDLSELPDSTSKLSKLTTLDLCNCFSLRKLPQDMGMLCELEMINIKDCSRLKLLPNSVVDLSMLKEVICSEEIKVLWETFLPSGSIVEFIHTKEEMNLDWLFDS